MNISKRAFALVPAAVGVFALAAPGVAGAQSTTAAPVPVFAEGETLTGNGAETLGGQFRFKQLAHVGTVPGTNVYSGTGGLGSGTVRSETTVPFRSVAGSNTTTVRFVVKAGSVAAGTPSALSAPFAVQGVERTNAFELTLRRRLATTDITLSNIKVDGVSVPGMLSVAGPNDPVSGAGKTAVIRGINGDDDITVDADLTVSGDQSQNGNENDRLNISTGSIPSVPANVSGTVDQRLSIALSNNNLSFGKFVPFSQGATVNPYTTTTNVLVRSTAQQATVTATDPSSVATGRLVNTQGGDFALANPLEISLASGGFGALTSPQTVVVDDLTPADTEGEYSESFPVSLRQTINPNEGLRTGTYSKVIVFSAAPTTP